MMVLPSSGVVPASTMPSFLPEPHTFSSQGAAIECELAQHDGLSFLGGGRIYPAAEAGGFLGGLARRVFSVTSNE
jgi:hypothetical protein